MADDRIAGVDIGMAKAGVIAASLARLGLPEAARPHDGVRALAAFYRTKVPRNRLADCTSCGGISDVNDAACPYCGDGTEEEDGAPAAIVPVASASLLTATDLDDAVKRVQALKVESAGSLWELGTEVRRIHSLGLWKLRTTEGGKPVHKAWGAFCESELGMSPTYAYKLIDVAEVYSREQVRTIGVAKLHVTLQVPKEHRDKLLERASAGASVKALSQEATQIGKKPKQSRSGHSTGGGARPGAGRKPEKITIAALIGRVEIPLMRGESDKPARNLGDKPRGVERLMNGVQQVFTLTKADDGQWILIVERARE